MGNISLCVCINVINRHKVMCVHDVVQGRHEMVIFLKQSSKGNGNHISVCRSVIKCHKEMCVHDVVQGRHVMTILKNNSQEEKGNISLCVEVLLSSTKECVYMMYNKDGNWWQSFKNQSSKEEEETRACCVQGCHNCRLDSKVCSWYDMMIVWSIILAGECIYVLQREIMFANSLSNNRNKK